jgi:ribosomal protein RSM22 (predicted rRNA methylase)
MRLPADLLEAIQQETDRIDRRKLAQAATQLSERYKTGDFSSPAIHSDADRAAYLAVRLPATYGATHRVLSEIKDISPQTEVTSVLDIGAGPGTTLFAADGEFPLQQATLIEVDSEWIALSKRLAAQSQSTAIQKAQWLTQDLRSGLSSQPHDLVVISYTLGELPSAAAENVLRKAWSYTNKFLVIIEPGTPRGFAVIDKARAALIAGSARILAPCPHQHVCPMAAVGDWCHFSQRIERTSQHRQLKGGTLGYEDEKFSYIIAGKSAASAEVADQVHGSSGASRIVRHPLKHSGHVKLTLCTPQGKIENQTVTRSNKSAYKTARKAEWGDKWTEQS